MRPLLGRNLLVWGIVVFVLCLIVIAIGSMIPVVGGALIAVATIIKPFAVAAAIIGAVIWLLQVFGIVR